VLLRAETTSHVQSSISQVSIFLPFGWAVALGILSSCHSLRTDAHTHDNFSCGWWIYFHLVLLSAALLPYLIFFPTPFQKLLSSFFLPFSRLTQACMVS
jgi:hypothetical protein